MTGTSDAGSTGGAETGSRSEDGNFWWDGVAWQPVEADPLAAQTSTADYEQPMDWGEFPEIARLLHYGEDIDVYLTDLGIDPNIMRDDEPFANA